MWQNMRLRIANSCLSFPERFLYLTSAVTNVNSSASSCFLGMKLYSIFQYLCLVYNTLFNSLRIFTLTPLLLLHIHVWISEIVAKKNEAAHKAKNKYTKHLRDHVK